MSNSIESYSAEVFSRAVGKKNIRLQKDFLYVVDVLLEYDDEEKNDRSIEIFCDLDEAVKEYESKCSPIIQYEKMELGFYGKSHPNITVILYQCYWDISKKALNKLLEMRKCQIKGRIG